MIHKDVEVSEENLPKMIKEIIKNLKKYDEENTVDSEINYCLEFEKLEVVAKTYVIAEELSEKKYYKLLEKYGGYIND